jgi:hypothetical protein
MSRYVFPGTCISYLNFTEQKDAYILFQCWKQTFKNSVIMFPHFCDRINKTESIWTPSEFNDSEKNVPSLT